MHNRIKKVLINVVIASMVMLFLYNKPVIAVNYLEDALDIMSTMDGGINAEHKIHFVLPPNSDPIEETDYIMVDLPQLSALTPPTFLTGDYEGTPVYSVQNTTVKITGVTLQPSQVMDIYGIQAYNPLNIGEIHVTLRVTADVDGTVVKNSISFSAMVTDGSIAVYAEIEAEYGSLQIAGHAAPGLFITMTEGGSVIGATSSDNTGFFAQYFTGMPSKLHTILVSGTDEDGRTTPVVAVMVFTRSFMRTEVTDILLAPIVSTNKAQIVKGEPITFQGKGPPGYLAKIFTEPQLESFEVNITGLGNFEYDYLDTSNLDIGDHKVYAMIRNEVGNQSLISLTAFFKVVEDIPDGPQPDCDISKGNLNCDAQDLVSLADFSILLYYWASTVPAADINNDRAVNITDFSIMMFYWTG